MKRLFILFLLLGIVLPASAVDAPNWSEFCPADKLYVEYRNMQRYPETFKRNLTHPLLFNICKYSIIGTPIALSMYATKYQEQLQNNYWAKRKQDFYNEIGSCDEMVDNDNKVSCYMEVRRLENEKTNQHEEQLLKEQEIRIERAQLYQQQQINDNLRYLRYNNYDRTPNMRTHDYMYNRY